MQKLSLIFQQFFSHRIWVMILITLTSCGKPFIKNAPQNSYYHYKNNIDVKEGKFIKSERTALIQRLTAQLDDSAKIIIEKKYGIFRVLNHPKIYDSNYTNESKINMLGSMFHLGYYNATITTRNDTTHKKITVTYTVKAGQPTTIESIKYQLSNPTLQSLITQWTSQRFLKVNSIINKADVITEIGRFVDSFRNNGYYKFTAAELKLKGDTTIDVLTSLSSDPFEQLNLISQIQQQKDTPKIKLAFVLNPNSDSIRLMKYYIKSIYVIPDYRQGDNIYDSTMKTIVTNGFTVKYHDKLFDTKLIARNVNLQPGQLYNQSEYYKCLYRFSSIGAWQSVNIQVEEDKDSSQFISLIIELSPSKKYGIENALEVSYSASSNTSNVLAGNLFGLSGNISLINRNLAKEAIRMSHVFRAGIEFNNNLAGNTRNLINSNEVGYTNTTTFPRLIFPKIPGLFNKQSLTNKGESFINLGVSYNTRLNLFDLRNISGSFGWSGTNKRNWKWIWTPLSFGFSNVLNQSDSFKNIISENPFLRYSYNTAFVNGMGVSFSKTFADLPHPNSLSRELAFRINAEESGLTWGLLPIVKKYKRRYIKADIEIKETIKYAKSSLALRGFIGLGVPLLGSDTNRTLPFFKQYFGGGSNSMRAWPVRGIGPGGRPLVPFTTTETVFNDRTGDMQLELNAEYRYDIAKIIPNTLTLRGAFFTDIGNIWNLKNTKLDGSADSSQIQLKNLYKQLGVSAGTGLRLDFNYFVLRLDFGFRFKRPERYYINDGWKSPDISFKDGFKKIFARGENDEYRKWRYENFNFTIGIGYAF